MLWLVSRRKAYILLVPTAVYILLTSLYHLHTVGVHVPFHHYSISRWSKGEDTCGSRYSVNVVVRTHPGKKHNLPVMLGSLLLACSRANHVSLHFFTMNTDPVLFKDTAYIRTSIRQQDQLLSLCQCSDFEILTFQEPPWPDFYGYDYTQYALEKILDRNQDHADYFLFTNGDNLFNEGLFLKVLPYFKDKSDLVAFSFVSHHLRYELLKPIKYELSYIDLSSVFFSKRVLSRNRTSTNFIPQGPITTGVFEADWHFINRMMGLNDVKASIAPGVLLFHQ